jgi:hypothetical protein
MAGYLDNITASRSNRLQRTNSGAAVSPQDRALIDQSAAARGNEFRKGLRRAVFNATATTDAFIGQMAEPFAPDFADRQFERAESTLRNQPVELRPAVAGFRQVNDLPSAVQYASGALGEGLASVGAMVAAGLLSRGAAFRAAPAVRNAAQYGGGVAAMLPQEGGETALTLRQNPEAMANTTAAERAALTLGRGTVNAALENIVPQALFTNQILGRTGRIAAGMRPAVENIARKSAAGVVGEAGTEAAQEFTGQFAENVAVPGTGYDTERAMEAAVRGAITGGVLGGAGGTVQAVRSNIDAAAEQAREAAGNVDTTDILNRTVERIDNIVRNPEQAGIDLTNTTMGALAEASARAGDLGEQASERAGPATARGMDAVATMRRNLDRGVLRRLTPENREKYRELTQNFRLLQPTEYARLRDAMDTADATEINRAVGDVAAQLYERVPRETMVGLRNLAKWGRDFGRGVTSAAREGRKAAQSYDRDDITRFRAFLNDQYPAMLRTMDSTEESDTLSRAFMYYRDNAQAFANLRPRDRQIADVFRRETGVEFTDMLDAARSWRTGTEADTASGQERAYRESTGDSQMDRLGQDMERLLTDDLRDQYEEMGMDIGPGATDRADGSVRREGDGELMNEEDTRRTPYNSLPQVRKLLAADLMNGELLRRKNPAFTLPATLRSDTLTAAQIGQLLGGKETVGDRNAGYQGREVPVDDDTIAMRTTEDGGYRQDFNSIDIAAQAGTPQERGGSRENFEGFVPEFDGSNRDLRVQGYRLLSAISSLNADGIEIPRSDIDPALLEEWGLDPKGDPIQIDVDMDPNTLSNDTVVQVGRKRTTIGDLNGANRSARSLDTQLQTLRDIEGSTTRALRGATGRQQQTADAILRGLRAFTAKQEGRGFWQLGAVEKNLLMDQYAEGYAADIERRISDSDARLKDRANQQRLNSGVRNGLFEPERVDDAVQVLEGVDDETLIFDREAEAESVFDENAVLAWADGLELEYSSTDELIDTLKTFQQEGLEIYELEQEAFNTEPGLDANNDFEEPTADDMFASRRRAPEGVETALRQAGIDRRRDSEAVRPEDVPRETPPAPLQAENVPRETPPPPAADDGDGTFVKDKRRVAERDTIEIDGENFPIAGEFQLFGETFVVHKTVDGSGWQVSHKDTGRGIGVKGVRSISGAAEAGVQRLQQAGRAEIERAMAQVQPTEPAPVPEQPTAAPMPIRINGTQYMVVVEEQPNAAGNIAWNRADGVHMVRGLTKERIIEYLQKPELRTAVQRRQAEVREQVSQRFEAEYGNSFVDLVSDLSEQQLKQLIILHESRHAQQRKKYGKEFGTTYRERPVDFEFDANRFALRELGIIDNESVPRETPPENIAVMPIEQERRLRETLMEQEAQIEAVLEDAREDGGPLGPPEPPQEPPEPPPAPPPPPPDNEARERFRRPCSACWATG